MPNERLNMFCGDGVASRNTPTWGISLLVFPNVDPNRGGFVYVSNTNLSDKMGGGGDWPNHLQNSLTKMPPLP